MAAQNAEGAGLAPYDSWLSARGLKTMALRMERQAHNCAVLAAYLDAHPLVTQVPSSHPAHLPRRKLSGMHGLSYPRSCQMPPSNRDGCLWSSIDGMAVVCPTEMSEM